MHQIIIDVAAFLGGATIISAAAWRWFIQPAFTKAVSEVVEANVAAALVPVMNELSTNSGKSLKDVVVRLDARMNAHMELHRLSQTSGE